jgi:hypothetical protein
VKVKELVTLRCHAAASPAESNMSHQLPRHPGPPPSRVRAICHGGAQELKVRRTGV